MSKAISRAEIMALKEMFPKGTEVICDCLEDKYHPVPAGTHGSYDVSMTSVQFMFRGKLEVRLALYTERINVTKQNKRRTRQNGGCEEAE